MNNNPSNDNYNYGKVAPNKLAQMTVIHALVLAVATGSVE